MIKFDMILSEALKSIRNLDGVPGKLLLAGGVGDFIAMESHLTQREINDVAVVYQVGYRPELVQPIANVVFEQLKHYIYFWSCLNSKQKTWDYQLKLLNLMRRYDSNIIDLTGRFFDKIRNGLHQYHGSSLENITLAEVDKFNLVDPYICICPHTINATEMWTHRTFSNQEWKAILQRLSKSNLMGVVIGKNCPIVPNDDKIINLNNATTILEALEILKRSCGYIGVDTGFSVLATKIFPRERLQISSRDLFNNQNLPIYFAPYKDFSFVVKEVTLSSLVEFRFEENRLLVV